MQYELKPLGTTFILAADLHLTSRADDAYRWSLFHHMANTIAEHKVTDVVLLGDIADFKDKHDSEFVNFLTDCLANLGTLCTVHFVMGNHDMVKPEVPFFEYIRHIPNVRYYKKPTDMGHTLFLPFTKNPEEAWADLDLSRFDFVMMHQPCIGSISSEHFELTSGMDPKYFSKKHPEFKGMVWSGDIHIPQTVGDVNYVGAPYPIRMGDTPLEGVEDRGYLLFTQTQEEWTIDNFSVPTLRKMTVQIKQPEDLQDKASILKNRAPSPYRDMLAVKVAFSADAYENWAEWKTLIHSIVEQDLGCTLKGLALQNKNIKFESVAKMAHTLSQLDSFNKHDVVQSIAKREKLDPALVQTALEILNYE